MFLSLQPNIVEQMVPINQQVIVAAVPGEDGGLVNVTGMQLQDGITNSEDGKSVC